MPLLGPLHLDRPERAVMCKRKREWSLLIGRLEFRWKKKIENLPSFRKSFKRVHVFIEPRLTWTLVSSAMSSLSAEMLTSQGMVMQLEPKKKTEVKSTSHQLALEEWSTVPFNSRTLLIPLVEFGSSVEPRRPLIMALAMAERALHSTVVFRRLGARGRKVVVLLAKRGVERVS